MKYSYNVVILSLCLLLMLLSTIENKEPASYVEQEETTINVQSYSENATKKDTIVYVTEYGTKYHRENCRYLRKSRIETKLSVAKEYGFEPCYVCKP